MSTFLIVSHRCDFCVAFCRYSSKAGSVKKMYLVNKNIVNLIDDILWKMGFKTEINAEKVIFRIISLILESNSDYTSYTNYCYCFYFRFSWILELQITCGRTNALISPDWLKPWAIRFVQPCVLVGWNTSRPPTLQDMRRFLHRTGHIDRAWRQVKICCFRSCQRGLFLQWNPFSCFEIMCIIAKRIKIKVE